MNENNYAAKAVYRVLIDAPIDTVWSELVNTTSPLEQGYTTMPASPEEMQNAMIANMKEKTGKTLEQWLTIAKKTGAVRPPAALISAST